MSAARCGLAARPARRFPVCVPVSTSWTRWAHPETPSVPLVFSLSASAVRRPHTLNSTSTSKSFQSTVTGELSAPYSKQFVHSKSSQYRKMKTEWKSNVYLARSRIQVSGGCMSRMARGGRGTLGERGLSSVRARRLQAAERDTLSGSVV